MAPALVPLRVCGLAVAVIAAACSPAAPDAPSATFRVAGTFAPGEVTGLRTATDVAFTAVTQCGEETCTVPLDIMAPEAGAALPTIVLIPGGPLAFADRRYLTPLATAIASRGAVVFLATWRSVETGNTNEDDGLNDVRCAVRYARAHTGEYGGDPERLLLVGKSSGSTLSLQVAVEADVEPEHCLASGSRLPDGVVAIAAFQISVLRQADAAAPRFWLVGGSEDENSSWGPLTTSDLEARGYEASWIELEGVTHENIHDPEANPRIVDIIMDAAEQTSP